MTVEIDPHSGFCPGVVTAIRKAEEELERTDTGTLYCLGDIVHNESEVERLKNKGLTTIGHGQMSQLKNCRVLLRAHGEPPSTYATARANGIELVDATCPVVLKLQQRIKATFTGQPDTQIVIYGKKGHAEVNGLVGQTDGRAIVIDSPEQLERIDFSRPIALYSQTTMGLDGFRQIIGLISQRAQACGGALTYHDTICRQVSNRVWQIKQFAAAHELIIFVAGAKSSNGRVLFEECAQVNANTHLLSDTADFSQDWLNGVESVGICGATSTPRWQMEQVRNLIMNLR